MRQMIIISVIMIMLLIFSVVSKSYVDSGEIVPRLLTTEEMKNIIGSDTTTCNEKCNKGTLAYTWYGTGCFSDDCPTSFPPDGTWCCPNGVAKPIVQFTAGTCAPLQGSTCTTSTIHIYQVVKFIIDNCTFFNRCDLEDGYTIDEYHDSCGHDTYNYYCQRCA